jgi:catalase
VHAKGIILEGEFTPDTHAKEITKAPHLTANTAEENRTLVFNPSNVPTGIETADMLSSFYSKAFRLSAKEERDVASVAGN